MELTTFKLLIDIGLSFFNLANSINGDRKKRVGEWIWELGDIIEHVAIDIENNEYPHMYCAKMQYMITAFPDMIKGLLEKEQISKLYQNLNDATNIERLFFEIEPLRPLDKKLCLIQLKETAGTLKGVGFTLQKD